MNKFLFNNEIKLKSKTMDMHLLLICDLQLNKTSEISNVNNKIMHLCCEDNAKKKFLFLQVPL